MAIYRRSFAAYRAQAPALLGPAVVVFGAIGLPVGLLQQYTGPDVADATLSVAAGLLGATALLLYTGYIDEVADHHRRGDVVRTGATLRELAPVVPALAVVSIAYALAVVVGLVLLIVPGIALATRLALCSSVVSLERTGPIVALRSSWTMTHGHFWLVALAVVLPLLAEGAASHVAEEAGSHLVTPDFVGAAIADAVVSVAIAPLVGLQMAFGYFALGGAGTD